MKVLSLFDGISCARVALDRCNIKYSSYSASEIDKYAIKISQKNYSDTIYLGDVKQVKGGDYDLIVGGSPCQGFSIAGKRLNFDDERSKLFFEFVRILKENKKCYFLLENVRMKKEYQEVISNLLGVEPIMINSSLVSGQNRVRLYWTNIPNVKQPDDKGIILESILDNSITERDKSYCIDANYYKGANLESYLNKKRRQLVINMPIRIGHYGNGGQGQRIFSTSGKSVTLSALAGGHGAKTGLYVIQKSKNGINKTYSINDLMVRKLTPLECERLQTLPDNYTEGVSNTQRYKALGNAFTVDVISHILKNMEVK